MIVVSRIRCLTYAILVIALLFSCSEPEIPPAPIEVPGSGPPPIPPKEDPLPTLLCAPYLVDGYCNKISYNPSDTVHVFFNSFENVDLCALTIYTINNHVAFSVPASLMIQVMTVNEPSQFGFEYESTIEFSIPQHVKSGVYLIENKVPFIVKPAGPVDLLIVYPSNTANAYATSGGKSLYSTNRPPAVSFHRPIPLEQFSGYCLTWFKTLSEIEIGYVADVDLDDYDNLQRTEILGIVGHNEYWTRQARSNFDRFVNEGHHAIILSGNTMWWQVRYEEDELVCYKSLDADPVADPLLKTYLWNSDELQYPIIGSIGADFDHGGYGLKADAGWNGFKVTKPTSPLFAGTGLQEGSIISCPTTEFDGAPIALWTNEIPELDLAAIPAVKGEILAYDKGFRVNETIGTFIVFRRSAESGIIIHTGSTEWCSNAGMGGISGSEIRRITKNAIYKLLNHENVFSD